MAKSADHYKKYQVYFFLYLAVICELLIIIVERDDAEANLLLKQRELEVKNRRIILELLKNMPAVAAAGDNQLKVNEERSFTIHVKGLGDKDRVTTPPLVHVYKDGAEVQTLRYPENINDSTLEATTGEKLYRFSWKADRGPGKFEFWVEAGTNRVELLPDMAGTGMIKVGSLDFKVAEIKTAIESDPQLRGTPVEHFIQRSEQLNPEKFMVEVVSEEYDQLQIQADQVVTAIGYRTFNEIKVRGTTVDKITNINVIGGGVSLSPDNQQNPFYSPDPERGKWVWVNSFTEEGRKTITVDARDKRNAGPKSVSKPVTFEVVVKKPILARRKPAGSFIGESFEMNVNVAGLEDVGSYAWTVSLDGQQVSDGSGAVVRYKVPIDAAGKSMVVKAKYRGRDFQLLPDSTSTNMQPSEFVFNVSAPTDRLTSPSFARNGEYPVNNVFQFVAARCGRCIPGNIRNIPRSEIRIEAESADGADLLNEVQVLDLPKSTSGAETGTLVKFFLKGKVSRDGTDATIRIRYGSVNETFNVTLFQE
jgi:hypothetical protein